MTRMDLVTFLINDVADSVERASRLSKYAVPGGGSPYYWAMKKGAEKVFLEGQGFDQAVAEVMSNMTVPHQRKHNQELLKGLYEWKLANPGVPHHPPAGVAVAPLGELIIKLEPAYAWEVKGTVTAYVPWPLKDLRLTPQVAGMGVYLLEQPLKHGPHANWRFAMIDVATKKCFSRTHKGTEAAVLFALRTQEEMLLAQKKAA